MGRHETIEAYNRAFTGIVRLRRRFGFPAWRTLEELNKGLDQRAPDVGTWRQFIEGKAQFATARLQAFYYICEETQGQVQWRHAHTVAPLKVDAYPDPQCRHGASLDTKCGKCDEAAALNDRTVRTSVPAAKKPLIKKKKLRRKT